MPKLVRSASLTDYLEVANAVGLDPFRMLAEVGLTRRYLENPDFKVPELAVNQLLEASAAASGVEDFGLRLAERRSLSNLGALALLIRDQPNVRKALEVWKQNRRMHTDSVSLRIEERDGIATISLVLYIERPQPTRQAVEMTVGVLYRTMKLFLGNEWKPRICFTHSAPHNCDTHRRVFRGRVEFGRDVNGIVCRSSDLDAAIPAAEPELARYAQQFIDSLRHSESSFTENVRELIDMMLSTGDFHMERIAKHLGVDRKTVHRKLAEEGTSFTAIVDSVRTDLVTRYIENRERPLCSVAEILGFSDTSAFSRWFKGRFGSTVSAWRAAHQVPRSSHLLQ